MRYELMLPHQIRDAIARNVPVVLPLGVMEYHGEHLAVGMDTLAVTRALDRLERDMEIVLLPAIPYGAASHAVAGPRNELGATGTLHVSGDALKSFAQELFTALLRSGFRNIHFFIHHQSENFAVGMPTDLAFKFAARQAIFAFLEETRGDGWWGKPEMGDYYDQQQTGGDPFNWIKAHPLMTRDIIGQYHFDHAGIGETSLMMALAPEAVDMSKHAPDEPWYTRGAEASTVELGEKAVALVLAEMRRLLK
jgi:creatinine amidohydrolase/Fe(II)-dependent formamide hydrolase-like protein